MIPNLLCATLWALSKDFQALVQVYFNQANETLPMEWDTTNIHPTSQEMSQIFEVR